MQNNQSEKSCWTCAFHDLDNETFLGKCTYFKTKGLPAKEIPPEIVDKGCSHFQPKKP
ncbi:hypothetical protein JW998_13420 [candidate division KSB1 bacterium]|nr:hypothetical protein [candidate division KSB1 bacterium]